MSVIRSPRIPFEPPGQGGRREEGDHEEGNKTSAHCGSTGEIRTGANDAWIAVAPVMAVSSKDSRRFLLDHKLGAVSIVLDFVNPVFALGWLINRGRKLWLDEFKPGMKHARHDR